MPCDLSSFCLSPTTVTAPGRREEGDFMGPCSKGPDIFKVPLSCCSVPEFLASCSYQIPLLPGRALVNKYYLPLASACSSSILLFSSQLLLILLSATCCLLPFPMPIPWASACSQRLILHSVPFFLPLKISITGLLFFPWFSKHILEWCFCPTYRIQRG